jgi:hypothetical protein
MGQTSNLPEGDIDEAAEAAALEQAVGEGRADRRGVPHAEMKAWLLKIAQGDLNAEPPKPREL